MHRDLQFQRCCFSFMEYPHFVIISHGTDVGAAYLQSSGAAAKDYEHILQHYIPDFHYLLYLN